MDSGIGYYTKELDNGQIELFVGLGDGVLISEGIFDSIEEADEFIEKYAD